MTVTATVTFLEMRAPFPRAARRALPPSLTLPLRYDAKAFIPLENYRALYKAVGEDWFWVNRTHMSDHTLSDIIHRSSTEIGLLYDDDEIIGFSEINRENFPTVEIVFIGLTRPYIGRGLGRFLLSHCLRDAILSGATRIKIQTSTLDHPHALAFYQKYGFEACNRQNVVLKDNQFYAVGAS